MTIDTAQFISELIISGDGAPQGTEDISEGDDQIVTAKRCLKQGFPNVDKEVSRTADELNDIVTKADAQTITGIKTHTDVIVLENFTPLEAKEVGGTRRGMLQITTLDVIRVGSTALALELRGASIKSNDRHEFQEGSTSLPGIRGAAPDDGISIGNGQIIISTSGAKRFTVTDNGNSSDERFEVQQWETFAASFITGTAAPTVSTPNAAAWTSSVPGGNVILVTHNFGHTN